MKHYSPSQINTFMKCQAAWKYRYIDGLKIPPASAMLVGTSYHAGIEHNYIKKIDTKIDEPLDVVLDVTAQKFDEVTSDEVLWSHDELDKGIDTAKGELKDDTIKLARKYHEDMAPTIQPKSVEEPFKIEFENTDYSLDGRIDLIDSENIIRENKTTARSPSTLSHEHMIQGICYTIAKETPNVIFDYAVKTKIPKLVSLDFKASDSDVLFVLNVLSLIDNVTKTGFFLPNRGHMLCSKKHCGYWQICVKEFGGQVK